LAGSDIPREKEAHRADSHTLVPGAGRCEAVLPL
jgi:hypothetical protein